MADFFRGQIDYIIFINGLALVSLALACHTPKFTAGRHLPWNWLLLFGLTQGVYQWLKLPAISLGDGLLLEGARAGTALLSFLFLAEFGRAGAAAVRGKGPGRWILAPLLLLSALGGLAGLPGMKAAAAYAMGLTGGFLTLLSLYTAGKKQHSFLLKAAGAALGLYSLLAVISVPSAPFPPASIINQDWLFRYFMPVDLFQGLLAVCAAVSIWAFRRISPGSGVTPAEISIRKRNMATMVSLSVVITLAGWGATQYWGNYAYKVIREDGRAHAGTLSTLLAGELMVAENSAMTLAGSTSIASALVSGAAGDIERANSVLDRYKVAMGASVCYVLDFRGITLAASNRSAPDSFVGKYYGFRPYFKEAMEGRAGRYFAQGITSGERGFYASFPVRGDLNRIIGVVVVKKNIELIEENFRRLSYSFFIDQNGVVFLSGRPEMLFRSLWPLTKEKAEELSSSRQFGPGPFEPLLSGELADGAGVVLDQKYYILHRQAVGKDGWSLVLLSPTDQVWLNRLFCICITLILFVLTAVFFIALQSIRESAARIRASEQQLRLQAAALESAANAVVITDVSGRIIWTNPAFTALTGYTAEEAPQMEVSMLKSGVQDPSYYQNLWDTIMSGRVWHGEIENLRKDGALYTEEQTITPVKDAEGKISHFVAIKQDVTKRKHQEQQLSYLATHDPLTGLPNRRLLEDALKRAVARSNRGAENSLLFMDLDNFKLVNDTLGHTAGDQVLFILTRVIQKHLRNSDLLARFGGDEFAVLLEGIGKDEALAVAERMRREVEEYRFVVDDQNFHLSLSIGLVVLERETHPGLVLSQADTAMYMAKELGRNRVVVYRPEDGAVARLTEANRWVARIKSALAENRFVLYYQPLVRMDSNRVDHYEALIRMKDGEGGVIPPGMFIPVAERYGLMSQVDRWVFEQVAKRIELQPSMRIFMNISGCSLADESLLEFIEKYLEERRVDPGRIGFEITETAVVQDLVAAERWVRRLKALGCRFALDDFGAGFNSFIYLHNLPVDQIKIDGYYIRLLENDPTRCALVKAMHALARTLGMETVAEFVENDAIMQIIKEIGITYGQGYHIDRPGPELSGMK